MREPDKGGCNDACARAIESARVQIELALADTHAPVQSLGETIAGLAELLRGIEPTTTYAEQHARLRAGLNSSIEKLQFHDRLVQQLTQVLDSLAAIADRLETDPSGLRDSAGEQTEKHDFAARGSVELF